MPRPTASLLADSTVPIGSEFSLEDADIRIKRNEQGAFIPKAYRKYWVASGRDALLALTKGLRLSRGDELLLPSYICPEVIQALVPHVRVSYYPVKADLSIDVCSFKSCICPTTRAVLLVHYFGFPHPQLDDVARACKDQGVMLIEDCVQAAFTKRNREALGSVGEAAFCSLRKFLPIPDGGWLVTHTSLPIKLKDSPAHRDYARLREAVLRTKILNLRNPKRIPDSFFNDVFKLADRGFGYPKPAPMARLSLDLLKRFPLSSWARQRRKNFQQLLQILPKKVRPVFRHLQAGVVPLGLPIIVRRRDALQQELAAKRIYAPVHWRLNAVPQEFEDAWELSRQLLTLPVDQRYEASDMGTIARVIRHCA